MNNPKRKLPDAPEIIKTFLVYLETIKGKSPGTVSEYFLDLRTFFRYIKMRRGLCPQDAEPETIGIDDVDLPLVASVTLTDIYEYLYYIARGRKNSVTTRSRKISSLRSYYKYLCEKTGTLKENPTRNLETPKRKKSLPKYLTLEESMEFLSHIDGEYRERDFCIMVLFLNCGMRLSELVGIDLADIHENTITVTGKGNKERTVYLNDACLSALAAYKAVRPHEGVVDKNALFLSRLKKRISPKTVQWVVKKSLAAAGLSDKGYSTHKLRHTAATLMYQKGHVDIRALQEILGHENLSTTEIYTHVSNEQLQKATDSSPLAHFNPQKRQK